MIYWRILLLALFVILISLMNMPRQIQQVEYSLSHNRTRMLELDLLQAKKELAVLSKQPYSLQYVEALDRLGWIYYQLSDVSHAEPTFTKELEVCAAHQSKGFDPTYEKCLLSLATYYRERANYDRAEHFYNLIRQYDLDHTKVPNAKSARDLANLGVLYFLWAETNPDLLKRSEMLCHGESFCETAQTQYQSVPGSERAQGDVSATQALILRELDQPTKAEKAANRSMQILADAHNKAIEP